MKRNIIKEIKFTRIRSHEFLNDRFIVHDLKEFESMINSTSVKESYEYSIYQLIPVAVCSAFESFFRFYVKELIDTKKIHTQGLLKIDEIKNFRCDILKLKELQENKISLGEIAAKLVSLSKMRSINAVFSLLLNCDFLKELIRFKTITKQPSNNLEQTYWDENFSLILKDLNAVYEVRNITCHEFGFVINIENSILLRYLKHGILFLERVSDFLHSLFYNRQIKKRKISEATLAKRDFLEVEIKLDELVSKVREYSSKIWYDTVYLSCNLKDEIFLWKKHRRKTARSNCWIYQGGKTYNCQYWREMATMTNEMINTITLRYEYLFGEVEKTLKIQTFI